MCGGASYVGVEPKEPNEVGLATTHGSATTRVIGRNAHRANGADVVLTWCWRGRRRGADVAPAWHWRGTGVALAWCWRGADVVLAWSPTWRRRGTGVGLAWWWRGGGVVLTWWWRGADVVLTGMRTVPTRPRSLYRTKRQVKDSARVKNVCGRASLVSSTYPHASRPPQSGTLYVQTSKRNRNSKTTATHPFENDRRPRSIARTNSSPVSNSST